MRSHAGERVGSNDARPCGSGGKTPMEAMVDSDGKEIVGALILEWENGVTRAAYQVEFGRTSTRFADCYT